MAQSLLLATLGSGLALIAPCVTHKTSMVGQYVVQVALIGFAILCWRLA